MLSSQMDKITEPLRVYLVDDSAVIRKCLGALVRAVTDAFVCGESGDAATAIEAWSKTEPDLVILDLSLPDASGLELLGIIRKHMPGTVVIIYSMFSMGKSGPQEVADAADYCFTKDDSVEVMAPLLAALATTRDLLRRQKRQLRLGSVALSAVPGAVVVTDPEGRIDWVNGAFEKHTGYTVEEALGRNIKLISSGKHDRAFYDQFWTTLRSGNPWRGEFINRRKDGALYSEEQLVTPIMDLKGRCTHFVSIKREALQTQYLEATAMERRDILRHASDAIVMYDLEDRVQVWNEAAQRVFGLSVVEAQGRSLRSFLAPSSHGAFDEGLESVLMRKQHWSAVLNVVRSTDGHVLNVELRLSPVLGPDGQVKGWLGFCTQRFMTGGETGPGSRSARSDPVSLGSAAVLHDMAGALDGILASLSSSSDSPDGLELEKVVDRILHETTGAKVTANRALQWLGLRPDSLVQVQLPPLLQEVQGLLREGLPGAVELKVEIADSLATVRGIPDLLRQAVVALAANAREAMPGGGVLSLRVATVHIDRAMRESMPGSREGEHVRIMLSDTGVGISPAELERIWTPFHTTKKGCGLGLAAVKWIVHAHGGFARVSSRLGKGTQFALHLPVQAGAPG